MDNIKLLQRLGLTEYESRAYLTLAKIGPSTVKEIVMDSHLPRNKAYDALLRLEQKNMIICLPFSPKKFQINNPEALRDEVKELDTTVNNILQIINQPKKLEFNELFVVMKGKKAIQDKLALQNGKAKQEILGCNKLSRVIYTNLHSMSAAVKRGVKVKMICTFEQKKIETYKQWMKTGAKIRVFNEKEFGPLLPRITVFDGKVSRLTVGRPEIKKDEDYLTLWTESRAFSQMLRSHFMTMWKKSKPIEEYI